MLVAAPVMAQEPASADTNMELSDAEGKVFWPLYDAYRSVTRWGSARMFALGPASAHHSPGLHQKAIQYGAAAHLARPFHGTTLPETVRGAIEPAPSS